LCGTHPTASNKVRDDLFHETVYDALKGIVARCGGAKAVGSRLWPHLAPDRAGQHLSNCLSTTRDEKLDPEQVVLLLRWGRESGYHDAKHWIDRECGYEPSAPVQPADRIAELLKALRESNERATRAADAVQRFLDEHGDAGATLAAPVPIRGMNTRQR